MSTTSKLAGVVSIQQHKEEDSHRSRFDGASNNIHMSARVLYLSSLNSARASPTMACTRQTAAAERKATAGS